jgi:hypothetical protein
MGKSNRQQESIYCKKKTIIVVAGVKRIVFCRELFKKLNILPFASEYLLSLLSFVVDNMEKFQTNSDINNINTSHKHDLHQPSANLTSYQKGAYYAGIKLFTTLPGSIKSLNHGIKVFKPALKDYLLSHSYSVEEFTSIENY